MPIPAVFEALAAGDILFIDSSHIAMPGTDVDRLFLDVLPRLAGGTLVHIHDITLPYAYPKIWDWRGYNEQLLAGALLQGGGYELVFASHFVARDRSDGFWPGHPVASCRWSRARTRPASGCASCNSRSGRSRLLPGLRHGMPASMYSFSLLRRVRIEMPRILAAWVRLPKQKVEGVEDQVTLHVGDGPADQDASQGIVQLRHGTDAAVRCLAVPTNPGCQARCEPVLREVIQEFMLILWLGSS